MALERTPSKARIIGQAVAGRRLNTKPEAPSAQLPWQCELSRFLLLIPSLTERGRR